MTMIYTMKDYNLDMVQVLGMMYLQFMNDVLKNIQCGKQLATSIIKRQISFLATYTLSTDSVLS